MSEPLQIKMTGKNGETDFYLYVKGEDKQINEVIKFLQKYLELSKKHNKIQEKTK